MIVKKASRVRGVRRTERNRTCFVATTTLGHSRVERGWVCGGCQEGGLLIKVYTVKYLLKLITPTKAAGPSAVRGRATVDGGSVGRGGGEERESVCEREISGVRAITRRLFLRGARTHLMIFNRLVRQDVHVPVFNSDRSIAVWEVGWWMEEGTVSKGGREREKERERERGERSELRHPSLSP